LFQRASVFAADADCRNGRLGIRHNGVLESLTSFDPLDWGFTQVPAQGFAPRQVAEFLMSWLI
jgi:hypothetical protein